MRTPWTALGPASIEGMLVPGRHLAAGLGCGSGCLPSELMPLCNPSKAHFFGGEEVMIEALEGRKTWVWPHLCHCVDLGAFLSPHRDNGTNPNGMINLNPPTHSLLESFGHILATQLLVMILLLLLAFNSQLGFELAGGVQSLWAHHWIGATRGGTSLKSLWEGAAGLGGVMNNFSSESYVSVNLASRCVWAIAPS